MNMVRFKRSGKAFQLRFDCFTLLGSCITPETCSDAYIPKLQVKFVGSSSEDHQFVRGLPIYAISQVLDKIISGANGSPLLINGVKRPMPLVRILEVELYPTLLSKARSFGLSDQWIQALVKKDPIRRQVLCVKGCLAGSKAMNLLEQGEGGEPLFDKRPKQFGIGRVLPSKKDLHHFVKHEVVSGCSHSAEADDSKMEHISVPSRLIVVVCF